MGAPHGRSRRSSASASRPGFYFSYRDDIVPARECIGSGSEVAQTAGGPVEYAVAGDGPPILVVHGAGGGSDQGLDIGADLAKRGFRIIAVSRFGYLRTPLPDNASAEAQADAHACLLDALSIPRAAFFGASAGAPSLKTPHWTQFLFDTALRSDLLFWSAIRFADETVSLAIVATPPEVVASASAEEGRDSRSSSGTSCPSARGGSGCSTMRRSPPRCRATNSRGSWRRPC